MSQAVQEQVAQLRAQIERHNRLYYVEAKTEITDREYDRLMRQLIDLEHEHPELRSADSPTQKVGGAAIDGFETVAHRIPMLSIDNVFELEGVQQFDARLRKRAEVDQIDYTLEYKIDGVALALIYEDGKLSQALTRGDGEKGDDITSNARTIGGVPLVLAGSQLPTRIEIRGEAYIANSDFALLRAAQQERGDLVHANPRNSTAGALKLLDPKLCAERKVRFLAHGIGDYADYQVQTHIEFMRQLQQMGVPITPGLKLCHGIDEVLTNTEQMLAELHTLDVEVDGLVIKVNDLDLRQQLGIRSKSPRWVVAYKWERYEAVTQVNDVLIQVGKTGALTPVAALNPVEIAGTTVSRSSLHNRDELERLGLKIGDWVVVEKAGKIIPHVVRVELERRDGSETEFEFPTHCPECATPVVQDEGGVYIRCPNPNCPARLRESLRFFASRQAMDVDGLGSKLVEQLVDAGLVTSLPDLFRLGEQRDELLAMERMGVKSVDNLLAGIERAKSQPLWRLLTGLNMRHVGVSNARILADRFGTLEMIRQQSVENLAAVPDIGDVIAESVHQFLHSEFGVDLTDQLQSLGLNFGTELPAQTEPPTQTPFSGKSIVATGTLVNFTRQGIQERIRLAGGKPSSSVSSKTDFLIAGDNAGSKLEKAEKLGIRILTEAQFEQMLEESAD